MNRIPVLLVAAVTLTLPCVAGLINPGFETGDFTGWTTFTTPGGTLGTGFPNVTLFDTDNNGSASNSAEFNVGGPGGGGILQNVALGAGTLQIDIDIAVKGGPLDNGSGGVFTLFVDGAAVDTFDFGGVSAVVSVFGSLNANLAVGAGLHEIRIQMTRPFLHSINTPTQYLDNIVLSGSAVLADVPEPSQGLGILLALAVIQCTRRKELRA